MPYAAVAPASRRFWNVPNTLTSAGWSWRWACIALIAYEAYAWALGVFLIAAVTDALDGYFARLLKQERRWAASSIR